MKNLRSFMVLNIGGVDRISYTYEEIDSDGNIIAKEKKGSMYAVDAELAAHIEAIRDFIRTNKLQEEV